MSRLENIISRLKLRSKRRGGISRGRNYFRYRTGPMSMRIAGKLTDRGAASGRAAVREFKARGVKRGRVYLRRYNTPRANPRPEQYLGRSTLPPFFTERNHNLHSSTEKSARSKIISLPCAIERKLKHKKGVIIASSILTVRAQY